jgi:lipopolysaccharide assembly outer membrane protein LptD (OstA)
MINTPGLLLFCAAFIATSAHAATFVIKADPSGHEAIITVPMGAVTNLSSNAAQTLAGYSNPKVEAMRLSGDVRIMVQGAKGPIQINADRVLLELIPDVATDFQKSVLRSTTVTDGGDNTQIFAGNVLFKIGTLSGPLRIRADRVTYRSETGSAI